MATEPLDAASVIKAGGGAAWTGMPGGTTIGHMHLHVGDLETARAFYHEALGLDVVVQGYPGALFLSAGGYHHHLGLNTWAGSRAPAAPADEPRMLSWDLVLPTAADVHAAAASLASAGAAATPEGAARVIADPWGTVVKLVLVR